MSRSSVGELASSSSLVQYTALLLARLAEEEAAGDLVLVGVLGERQLCLLSWAARVSHAEMQLVTDKELLVLGTGQAGLGFISTSSTLVALTGPGTGLTWGESTGHWGAKWKDCTVTHMYG